MSALDRMTRFMTDLTHRRSMKRLNHGAVKTRYARAWQIPSADLAEFCLEIGDSPYGKKGTWKMEIDLGVFPKFFTSQLGHEIVASNPEAFGDYFYGYEQEVFLRQVIRK